METETVIYRTSEKHGGVYPHVALQTFGREHSSMKREGVLTGSLLDVTPAALARRSPIISSSLLISLSVAFTIRYKYCPHKF